MPTINKVILVGYAGADPEVRYLDRGLALATLRLATAEPGYVTPQGIEVAERTEWHSVVMWRQLAEWAEQYVKKGMLLYVEGKLQTRHWEQDGVSRSKTEIVAENVQLLSPKPAAGES